MKRGILFCFVCFLAIVTVQLYGEETVTSDINEEDMFSDGMINDDTTTETENDKVDKEDPFADDMVEEFDDTNLDSGLENLLLKSDKMEWGGRYKFSLSPSWTWQSDNLTGDYIMKNITEADISAFTTTLQATIFFDARPDENFRVFGKTEINAPLETSSERTLEDIISIRELFSDFNWKDTLFFRAGKQTIKWGVGYFFSPADVLNLIPIDPEEPELDREGPLSLKLQIPISIHNLYFYLLADNASYPEDIGIASKFEFVMGTLETGIGGFYQKDSPPNGVVLLSYPVLSYLDLFGEAVISYGSNETFLEEVDGIPAFVSKDDEMFFSGTIGFSFSLNQVDTEWEAVSLIVQYFYNGQGISETSLLDYAPDLGFIPNSNVIFQGLLARSMHYAAGSLMWSEIFDSDFSASLFWIGNLADGSGQIIPSITWNIMDYASTVLSFPITYSGQLAELVPMNQSIGVKLEVSLGSGNF
ncbi:MAG: hypothetical protein OQK82_04535 [Candidatus Pacearchaeota archaeon]|nr:hypothetical protein [Candidatus Pacearchaeota archaeon]